jgi:AraC-like DNA-binding protein
MYGDPTSDQGPALAMSYFVTQPSESLRDLVQAIWMVDTPFSVGRDRILPNGIVELIINLASNEQGVVDEQRPERSQRFKRAWVAGLQRGPLVIDSASESNLIGIRFAAGRARDFLGVPLHELTDLVVEADTLALPRLEELRERLAESGSHAARVACVEQWLLDSGPCRDAPLDSVQYAVSQLRDPTTPRRIRDISADLGLTHRQLIDRFRDAVGVTPRRLARIYRLQAVIRYLDRCSRANWSRVAADCGFADQAHLIRELRDLAGVTPTEYLALRDAQDSDHVREP